MKKILLTVCMVAAVLIPADACTNFIVGKKASADGSVIVSYNADSYGMFGFLCHYPAATHAPGEKRVIRDWDTNKYLGEIDEAPVTYNVIGNMNEYQVCICETTFGGRHELADSTGVMDYGSLIYVGLQRSKTAREAIKVMTDLVAKYGYYSEGESFTIADKEEAWIMEMVGKGPGSKGAVWVAIRIPDDCISSHANQSRITTFPLKDPENCIYSKDVIKFAREKGYFSGKDSEFSFRDAYNPLEFSGIRYCDARVWSFFRYYDDSMDQYLPYINGDVNAPSMPLYIKPNRKVSVRDIQQNMRDHYEGTALDLTQDLGAGAWSMPYRPSPLSFKADGKSYFNERPISTQQSAFTLVGQMRSWLPDELGGILWFGCDDANMIAYTPVYCCTTDVPEAYAKETADGVTFSDKSAFWLCNMVSNYIYPRYSAIIGDLRTAQNELEDFYAADQKVVEAKATALDETARKAMLNQKTSEYTAQMMERWHNLWGYIVVKHNDMVLKKEKDGKFELTPDGLPASPIRTGYPQHFNDAVGKATGERYLMK